MPLPMPSATDKMQRKRAARACDQCRRRKSRCDGQMNCSACVTIGLQCSFGHQVKQSRGPAYVAHLEKKISDLQEQLRRQSNASEGSVDDGPSTGRTSPTFSAAGQSPIISKQGSFSNGDIPSSNATTAFSPGSSSEFIDSLTSEPRGKPFGIDILRQLCNFCNQISRSQSFPPFPEDTPLKIVQALDSTHCIDSVSASAAGNPLLPPKPGAQRMIDIAFSEAFELWPFVDRCQVERTICRLYTTNSFGTELSDRDDLALVYATLALGSRFDAASHVAAEARRTQGLAYFAAAKECVPFAQCDRSLTAIQVMLCLALYLKAASAPTKVHAYVGAAASAALRLGIHEQIPCYPKDESAQRQRVWSTIRVLDIYTSTVLGIPSITATAFTDQSAFPPLSTGSNAELVASDAHMDLLDILAKAISSTYCSPSVERPNGRGSYRVPKESLQYGSDDLESWAQNYLVLFQNPEHMTRSQLLLAYAYDYSQLLLYGPFVHHIALGRPRHGSDQYKFGLKAVHAALHAVQLAELLQARLQLNEAHFFTVDALVYAAVTLLVVELGGLDSGLEIEAMRAGRNAKELLLVLSLHSTTAAECWQILALRSSSVSDAVLGASNPGCMYPSQAASSSPVAQWKPAMYTFDSGVGMDMYRRAS